MLVSRYINDYDKEIISLDEFQREFNSRKNAYQNMQKNNFWDNLSINRKGK
jgi:hypothetical protein